MSVFKMTLWMTLLIVLAISSNAQIYRWEDEQGNVRFGDKPPADDAKAELIETKPNQPFSQTDLSVPVLTKTTRVVADRVDGVENFTVYRDNPPFVNGTGSWFHYEFVAFDDTVWLNADDHLIEVNTVEQTARTHKFSNGADRLSTRSTRFLADRIALLNSSDYSLSVFDMSSGDYESHELANAPRRFLIPIFGKADRPFYAYYHEGAVHRFELRVESQKLRLITAAHPLKRSPSQIANSGDSTLYMFAKRKRSARNKCLLEFYDSDHANPQSFSNKEIGIPVNWGCYILAADEKEVWLQATFSGTYALYGSPRARTLVFSVKDRSWREFEATADGRPFGFAGFKTLTDDYAFFTGCRVLHRFDRESKLVSSLDLSPFIDNPRYCWNPNNSIEISEDNIYLLRRHEERYRVHPRIFKVPMDSFEKASSG